MEKLLKDEIIGIRLDHKMRLSVLPQIEFLFEEAFIHK